MRIDFQAIEAKWKAFWEKHHVYQVSHDEGRPKYYVLDMFPYPSGSGLHVGHPLGYVASDILSRHKRMSGYNVLHPMGFDAFGLPAEQYAIQTNVHPSVATDKNIAHYKEQLSNIGFSYDWSREVRTSDPSFYKWTQWIFLQLFGHYYDQRLERAQSIDALITTFGKEGNASVQAATTQEQIFTAQEWNAMSSAERDSILMNYRLAYRKVSYVNWCEALGTVLANDEVKDGVSERGGYPVERKPMLQWSLRISAYAERMLRDLDNLEWSDAMKAMQANWIGRSEGAQLDFAIANPQIFFDIDKIKNDISDAAYDVLNNRLFAQRASYPYFAFNYPVKLHDGRKAFLGISYHEQLLFLNWEETDQDDSGFSQLIKDQIAALDKVNVPLLEEVMDAVDNKIRQLDEGFVNELKDLSIRIFTTRPDTIYGATFMVLAPEHPVVPKIASSAQWDEVSKYIDFVKTRSERDRLATKQVTGVFTGAYAINPFTGQEIPVWIADYVLMDYGTGAIMAVPGDDTRDRTFATKFNLPVIEVIDRPEGSEIGDKEGTMINSGPLNGLPVKEAISRILDDIESRRLGTRIVQYKMRDAIYSRQRYWGEPVPIIYDKDGVAHAMPERDLPLVLPDLEDFKPGGSASPLGRVTEWVNLPDGKHRDTDTMPGYAGSSWYYLRYMDPKNDQRFAGEDALNYWRDVDLYIGGTEHAVGHLMYARFWHKFLFDKGLVPTNEPFRRLVNQGMIQGVIESVYRSTITPPGYNQVFKSANLVIDTMSADPHLIPIPVNLVEKDEQGRSYLTIKGIQKLLEWKPDFGDKALFVSSNNETYFPETGYQSSNDDSIFKLYTHSEVGKMGKRYHNAVDPNEVVAQHGADCFRMYEMFLGPLEQAKPWDTRNIDGVGRFLKKFWSLYHDEDNVFVVVDDEPTRGELRLLHQTLHQIKQDIARLSLNTCVSQFMIVTNELKKMNCRKRVILEPLVQMIAPFAPFIAEELWEKLGHQESVHLSSYPEYDAALAAEDTILYPVCVNGKKRTEMEFDANADQKQIEAQVMADEAVIKWLEGKQPKKVIIVPGRMVNLVV